MGAIGQVQVEVGSLKEVTSKLRKDFEAGEVWHITVRWLNHSIKSP